MITIVNITPSQIGGGPNVCEYLLTIPRSQKVQFTFTHDRSKGLAQCLRDAADEWERIKKEGGDAK